MIVILQIQWRFGKALGRRIAFRFQIEYAPFASALVTIGTIVHGGAIASLIDTAAMVAAWSDAEVSAKARGTAVNLLVSYLAPAEKDPSPSLR